MSTFSPQNWKTSDSQSLKNIKHSSNNSKNFTKLHKYSHCSLVSCRHAPLWGVAYHHKPICNYAPGLLTKRKIYKGIDRALSHQLEQFFPLKFSAQPLPIGYRKARPAIRTAGRLCSAGSVAVDWSVSPTYISRVAIPPHPPQSHTNNGKQYIDHEKIAGNGASRDPVS